MTLKTFFVEDNATIRENLIETLLELSDVEPVGYAETEAEGTAWLTDPHNDWDLAIVDLFLRQGSGLGVVAACQKRKPSQRVIVLSNYAPWTSGSDAPNWGWTPFSTNPMRSNHCWTSAWKWAESAGKHMGIKKLGDTQLFCPRDSEH